MIHFGVTPPNFYDSVMTTKSLMAKWRVTPLLSPWTGQWFVEVDLIFKETYGNLIPTPLQFCKIYLGKEDFSHLVHVNDHEHPTSWKSKAAAAAALAIPAPGSTPPPTAAPTLAMPLGRESQGPRWNKMLWCFGLVWLRLVWEMMETYAYAFLYKRYN